MDWTKFIVATLIGGIIYFICGSVVYGIVLYDLTALAPEIASVVQYSEDEFRMSYMIIACLVLGALYALILIKWAQVSTFLGGFKVTAVIGALITLSVGFSMSSMFKMNTVDQILINTIGDIICSGLAGGGIGWYLGKNK